MKKTQGVYYNHHFIKSTVGMQASVRQFETNKIQHLIFLQTNIKTTTLKKIVGLQFYINY